MAPRIPQPPGVNVQGLASSEGIWGTWLAAAKAAGKSVDWAKKNLGKAHLTANATPAQIKAAVERLGGKQYDPQLIEKISAAGVSDTSLQRRVAEKLGDTAPDLESVNTVLNEIAKGSDDDAKKAVALVADKVSKGQKIGTQSPPNTGPGFEGLDDPTKFEPVFLSDQGIEDLARTGEFDIGPKEIAAMFPTAAVQARAAGFDPLTGQELAEPVGPSLIDQAQPAQYKNNEFVNIGAGGLGQLDTASMQRNQIADSDLPDWEKKVLLAEIDQQEKPQAKMTEEEYNAARMKIFSEGSVGPERELKLQKLAQAYSAAKAQTKGTGSLRDIISKPYNMTASEVSAAAVQLFKAGYLNLQDYDPEKKLSEQMHITSAFDPAFQKAWNTWVGDSFKDRSKSMQQILQERQTSFMGQLQLYADQIKAKQAEARAKQAAAIQVSDPAGIRVTSDQIGVEAIGRKLTDVEHQMLISYIHNMETAQQSAIIGGATNVENVDVNARLLEAIRANNPVAADATDEANQYKAFTSLLAGPRGM